MNEDDSGDFPHMCVPNYFREYFKQVFRVRKTIPINVMPEKMIEFTLDGFGSATFTVEDETLNNILKMFAHHLGLLKKMYGKKHLFSEPDFRFTPDGKFTLRIGMMSKEEYKLRFPKKKAKNGK